MSYNWDNRFMAIAHMVATWSKDPTKKVGALVVSPDRRSWTAGYNGFPAGVKDDDLRLGNKEIKNRLMVHAETNAILNARRDISGWTLYCTHPPCMQKGCCQAIIQAGIVRVVRPPITRASRWWVDQLDGNSLLEEAGVGVTVIGGGDFDGSQP